MEQARSQGSLPPAPQGRTDTRHPESDRAFEQAPTDAAARRAGRGDRRRFGKTPLLVVALWLVWSSVFVAIKVGLGSVSPDLFVALRVTVAVLVLAPVYALVPQRKERLGLIGHAAAAGLSLTNVTGFLLLQTLGMVEAGVGTSAMLIYTQPLLVAVLARVVLSEAVSVRTLIGLWLGWSGVVLLVREELGRGSLPWASVALLLAAALCWATGTVILKMTPPSLPIWRLLFWQNLYAVAPVWLPPILGDPRVDWTPGFVASTVWAGAAGGVLGFAIQFSLLRRGAATTVSALIFPVPLLSAVAGVVLLDEPAHMGLVAGGICVAAGIYLVNTKRRRSGPAHVAPDPSSPFRPRGNRR